MIKNKIKIGVIGGSGLDNPQILSKPKEIQVKTPFGKTSDKLICGQIDNKEVVVLARHSKSHSLMPTKIPFRANLWALKEIGCTHLLATTACGSLREEMKPGDLVFIDQFIDFTKKRDLTFFENKVVHTPMAEPFDLNLRKKLIQTAKKLNYSYHSQGTMITIEGPRFSTKAESFMFKNWGADLINMSTVPEVILANELKVPYQAIAMVTDYDCWKVNEKSVTFELIVERMNQSAEKIKNLLFKTISLL